MFLISYVGFPNSYVKFSGYITELTRSYLTQLRQYSDRKRIRIRIQAFAEKNRNISVLKHEIFLSALNYLDPVTHLNANPDSKDWFQL